MYYSISNVKHVTLMDFWPQNRKFIKFLPSNARFILESKSQNRNPISPIPMFILGIIQVRTKACQLCSRPLILVSINMLKSIKIYLTLSFMNTHARLYPLRVITMYIYKLSCWYIEQKITCKVYWCRIRYIILHKLRK